MLLLVSFCVLVELDVKFIVIVTEVTPMSNVVQLLCYQYVV